ncbi:MAG: hypothetical protein V8Q88_00390 [Christensenellales bacterium]
MELHLSLFASIRAKFESETEDGSAVSYKCHVPVGSICRSEDLADKVAGSMDAVLEACRANEIRKAEKAEALMLDANKVLQEQSVNNMLAVTELYETMIGGE